MPLSFLTDSYIDSPTLGDLMEFSGKWKTLSLASQEALAKAATRKLDLLDFYGSKAAPAQPLQFPRIFSNSNDPTFSQENQERRLKRACQAQVEYYLNHEGIGITDHSNAGESIALRNDSLCREARTALAPYMRGWGMS